MGKITKKLPAKVRRVAEYKPSEDIGRRYVNLSNALIRAGHGLTLAEKRLVAMGVATLDSYQPRTAYDVPTSRIHAEDYAKQFGVDINTAYDQLKSASKQLYKRSITFFEPAYNRRGKPIEPALVTSRWVGSVRYHAKEGWVSLHWWPELMPHLTGLKRQFTSYRLGAASGLRSEYAWRLLELLMRFKSSGVAKYTIEDFRVSLDVPASYADFGIIRQKVIVPAVNNLRKSGWKVDWKPLKAGRKVKALAFQFVPDNQLELPGLEAADTNDLKFDPKLIEELQAEMENEIPAAFLD